MAQFHVTIEVAPLSGSSWVPVEVLVDTGATYTKVPRDLLSALGVRPSVNRRAQIANGQFIERHLADAMIRLNEEEHPNLVVFGEAGEEPLLGSVTLETFSLGVDPVNKRLIPVHALEMTS